MTASKRVTGAENFHLVLPKSLSQHHQFCESNTRTDLTQFKIFKTHYKTFQQPAISLIHFFFHLESNSSINYNQSAMLFANVFFQTKPMVQALDPDTHIWEDAKIGGFEGTNHVRVNFTRWGKTKTPFVCFFVTTKLISSFGQSGKQLKKFYFPDDTTSTTNLITPKKNSRKAMLYIMLDRLRHQLVI